MHGETKNMGQLFSKFNKDKPGNLVTESVFGNERFYTRRNQETCRK
jgi:hypothetical protein